MNLGKLRGRKWRNTCIVVVGCHAPDDASFEERCQVFEQKNWGRPGYTRPANEGVHLYSAVRLRRPIRTPRKVARGNDLSSAVNAATSPSCFPGRLVSASVTPVGSLMIGGPVCSSRSGACPATGFGRMEYRGYDLFARSREVPFASAFPRIAPRLDFSSHLPPPVASYRLPAFSIFSSRCV